MNPRVCQVIATDLLQRGTGTEDDPVRSIQQYFSLDGELLAEVDAVPERQRALQREVERLRTMLEGVGEAATRDAEEKQRTIDGFARRFSDLRRLEELLGTLAMYGKAVRQKNRRVRNRCESKLAILLDRLKVEAVAEASAGTNKS